MRIGDVARRGTAAAAALGALMLATAPLRGDVPTSSLPNPHIPFTGPGRLLTVWSWGQEAPRSRWALAVTTSDGTREVALPAGSNEEVKPAAARWRSPQAAVVEIRVLAPGTSMRSRIVRVELDGPRIVPLLEGGGLLDVSPDGQKVVVQRIDSKGPQGLAVWSIDPPRELAVRPGSSGEGDTESSASPVVWDPTSTRMAAGILTGTDRLLPQLALLSGDLRERTWVADAPDGGREHRGTGPLFWAGQDLYAASRKGLLRCAVDRGGCVAVYDPGVGRVIHRGTLVATHRALLLVADQREDVLETRAKELHEFDLETGRGRLLYTLPGDAFLSDIDWID